MPLTLTGPELVENWTTLKSFGGSFWYNRPTVFRHGVNRFMFIMANDNGAASNATPYVRVYKRVPGGPTWNEVAPGGSPLISNGLVVTAHEHTTLTAAHLVGGTSLQVVNSAVYVPAPPFHPGRREPHQWALLHAGQCNRDPRRDPSYDRNRRILGQSGTHRERGLAHRFRRGQLFAARLPDLPLAPD